jgi:hypothetical protein
MTLAAAPDFVLPSAFGAPVALLAGRPTLLLFVSEECPTCALTLQAAGARGDVRGGGAAGG